MLGVDRRQPTTDPNATRCVSACAGAFVGAKHLHLYDRDDIELQPAMSIRTTSIHIGKCIAPTCRATMIDRWTPHVAVPQFQNPLTETPTKPVMPIAQAPTRCASTDWSST